MAERSFAKEVQSLRLTEGAEFEGEGILAVTKALLQSGVGYVGGYQGAPISHLMDVLADASVILSELGVRFESSASEATAAFNVAASISSSATRHPSARNRFAVASPMPRAAPVTRATFAVESGIGNPS